MVIWVAAALAALLALLAAWQRRVERRRHAAAVEAIREARLLGADRPVGQHPRIDALRCIGCGSCVRACPEDGVLALVEGVARVVQAARCIGHARCEAVCPVGAVRVGLGEVAERDDVPFRTEELETNVPGLFVAGELGGMALIRHAVAEGSRAADAVARRAARGRTRAGAFDADVLVAGLGPAGLSATLRSIELGLRHVAIDQSDVGGTVRKYPRRKLVMTEPVALPLHGKLRRHEYRKEELIDLWDGIVREHGIALRSGVRLLGVERRDGGFVASTSEGPIAARFVVLALGRRGTPRTLGVPGEAAGKVLYQLADAASYTARRLLVVGGGDSAIEAATALADQPGNAVTLSYRKEAFFRVKRRNAERIRAYAESGRVEVAFASEVRAIAEDHVVLALRGVERRIENDHVFVFAGGDPPFPLLRAAGVRFGGAPA